MAAKPMSSELSCPSHQKGKPVQAAAVDRHKENLSSSGSLRNSQLQALNPEGQALVDPLDHATAQLFPISKTEKTYAVSYAWQEPSVNLVTKLCLEAQQRGIHILRDTDDLGIGMKISTFMASIAKQNRVFVILSDRYLRSENCMFELMEIWRTCLQDEVRFHRQVRVFRMPDAKISDLAYQLDLIEHWDQQQEVLGPRLARHAEKGRLGESMLRRFNNLNAFARHMGEIVPYIADRLRPKNFEDFVRTGFTE